LKHTKNSELNSQQVDTFKIAYSLNTTYCATNLSSVWLHCECLDIKKRRVPDKFLCPTCKPRPLKFTTEQARDLQTKKHAQQQKSRGQPRGRKLAVIARVKNSTSVVGTTAQRKGSTTCSQRAASAKRHPADRGVKAAEVIEEFYANFAAVDVNEYSNEIRKAIGAESDSVRLQITSNYTPY